MAKLNRSAARDILQRCHVDIDSDFHVLGSGAVERLLVEAARLGYRKPRNANGSRGRYFHAYVTRAARREY